MVSFQRKKKYHTKTLRYKKFRTYIKFLIVIFGSFFLFALSLFVLGFSALFITCNYKDIVVENKVLIKNIARIFEKKNSGLSFEFEKMIFKQNPIKNMVLKVELYDLNLTTKDGVFLTKINKVGFQVAPHYFIKGNIIKSFDELSNFTFNIPVLKIEKDGKENNLTTNTFSEFLNETSGAASIFTSVFVSTSYRYKHMLKNGIFFKNIKVKPHMANKNIRVDDVLIDKSETQLVKVSDINTQEQKLLTQLMNFEKNGDEDTFSTNGIKKKMLTLLSNVNDSWYAIVHKTKFKIGGKTNTINAVCNVEFDEISGCVIELKDFKIDVLASIFGKNNFSNNKSDIKTNVFLKFSNNKIEKAKFVSTLSVHEPVEYNNTKISLKEITTSISSNDNFNKSYINISAKNNTMQEIINFELKNLTFLSQKPSFDAEIRFKNFDLSKLFSFIKISPYSNEQPQTIATGIIDGNLKITVKDGKPIKNSAKTSDMKLKKIVIKSDDVDIDLSELEINITSVGEKIMFTTQTNANGDEIVAFFDLKKNIFECDIKNFFLSKTGFEKLKNTIVLSKQKFFLRDIRYEMLIDAHIKVFIKNGKIDFESSIFDFSAKITDENIYDLKSNKALLTIKKK